ncbi:hypothetical protein U1Q18_046769 [Sarracenia purpurea var. burkii]
MGCSSSKLDNQEAVQLCKDRKRFIKQAVEHRTHFVSGHIAYIQSLKRVSAALCDYVEGHESSDFLTDSCENSADFMSISPKTSVQINYLRSGENPSVTVEETPKSPETVRIETYSPTQNYEIDGSFTMQSSPTNSSFFSYSPSHRSYFPPPSPQISQWDSFWNPFSSLDHYGYPTWSTLDQTVHTDEITGLRQVREEEKEEEIPKIEEKAEHRESDKNVNLPKESMESRTETEHRVGGLHSYGGQGIIEVSNPQNAMEKMEIGDRGANEEKPVFTVYMNRKPKSMAEVFKDLEAQFMIGCSAADEVSSLLVSSRAQNSSTSNVELTGVKMLNPVALFHSASSRLSSSSFLLINTSRSRDEDSSISSGSHQLTLERLYAWEKKLYEEVRGAERIRIAYQKKCSQLKNHEVKEEGPTSVDKSSAAIRDLHSQIKVSIHSVESISKRIETLRDEELQPQLLELVRGLAKMWNVIAECHQLQKRTLDEAKLILTGTPPKLSEMKKKHNTIMLPSDPHRLVHSAANLETELRNWRTCFESWITSQRSYVHALTGWLLRCFQCDPDTSKLPFSPTWSVDIPSIFGMCIQWSRFLDAICERAVLDGIGFFVSGIGSLNAQQPRNQDSRQNVDGFARFGGGLSMETGWNIEAAAVEVGQLEEAAVLTAEKMAEVGKRVLYAGMSVAVSSLVEFAIGSAEGYADLVKQWENAKWPHISGGK